MPLPWNPDERPVAYAGSVATFRTPGNAATTQILATVEMPANTTRLARVVGLEFGQDATAVLTSVAGVVRLSRTTAMPTGGTVLPLVPADKGLLPGVAVVRGATASDGGAATPITVSLDTSAASSALLMRLHTAVGQVLRQPADLLPTAGFVLRAGEAAAIHIVAPGGTSNPATNHYLVRVTLEEFA
jgi:hypothetical protein